jgi:ribosome maturation factor RimP
LISEKISSLLDNLDLIKDEYSLEISSPGAERQLKTKEAVEKAIGQYVNVRLYRPMDNSKEFEGNLIAFAAEILTIEYKAKTTVKTIEIPYAQVSKIRLAIQF